MGSAETVNIKSLQRRRQMNIGIILFAFVFLYLIATVILYASKKKTAVYEVREGSMVDDISLRGLLLRNEEVIPAQEGGYIYYLASKDSKIAAGSEAYVITKEPLQIGEDFKSEGEISEKKQKEFLRLVQNFNEKYSPQRFFSVSTFKKEISDFLFQVDDVTKASRIGEILGKNKMEGEVFSAPFDGIMLCYVDGYEDVTEDTFTASDLIEEGYQACDLRDNDLVKQGEAAYKLVREEDFKVIVRVDDKIANRLLESKKKIKTRINQDSEALTPEISLIEKGGEFYGIFTYHECMARYAQERFVDIEIIFEETKGLKIPVSSLVEEDFYALPKGCVRRGEGSFNRGVDLVKEDGQEEFIPTRIVKVTSGHVYYIEREGILLHSLIMNHDSKSEYEISQTTRLSGVYNLNKGYAEFEVADILLLGKDYCIVNSSDGYGIQNYDRIAQDAKTVSEGEVNF